MKGTINEISEGKSCTDISIFMSMNHGQKIGKMEYQIKCYFIG